MSKVNLESTFAPIPEVERGRVFNIKVDPKGEKFIYCVSSSVIIRDIKDPGKCEEVVHHAKKVTAAAYSPSGYYICSGDITGTIKIWDTVNPEHNVKYEYRVLSGAIADICWSNDSKRIVVAGDGKEKFAHVISWDTGTSVGNIVGHNKRLLSCDMKQTRPMAIVTGGEDMTVVQCRGPPFKYNCTLTNHTSFVNCVRYSPDCTQVASCGQGGKIFVYDALEMDKCFELVDTNNKAHTGGVYSISWSSDSKYLLSASADRTCKIWNISEKKCETTFNLGKNLTDQQLGCIWVGDNIISISLSGKINFLNKCQPDTLLGYFWGHNKGVVCMIASEDKQFIYTSSFDGIINCWDVKTGACMLIEGSTFKSQVSTMDLIGDTIGCCGYDDKVRFICASQKKFKDIPAIQLASQPQQLVLAKENVAVVGCLSDLVLIVDSSIVCVLKTDYEVKGLAVVSNDDGSFTVVAGGNNKKLLFYKLEGNSLTIDNSKQPISLSHEVTYIKFSPNGKFFSVCTTIKTMLVYETTSLQLIEQWSGHANRVSCVSWRPDNSYLATCGVDGNFNIWCKDERFFRIEHRNAHKAYSIPSVVWLNNDTIATVAQQSYTIKFWKIKI